MELKQKRTVFIDKTKTRKTIFISMVTTYGVKNIKNYPALIQNEITMESLFK